MKRRVARRRAFSDDTIEWKLRQTTGEAHAITTLSVAGFKSIVDEQTIEIRPLTLLAGANSSGKSSMMQPLLLLKQTLEAPYDPGPLLLNGANVKFTSVSQFWPSLCGREPMQFVVSIGGSDRREFVVAFRWHKKKKKLKLDYNVYTVGDSQNAIRESTSTDDIAKRYIENMQGKLDPASLRLIQEQVSSLRQEIVRSRFFFEMVQFMKDAPPGQRKFLGSVYLISAKHCLRRTCPAHSEADPACRPNSGSRGCDRLQPRRIELVRPQ